jgi:hypothetical protein
MKVTPIASPLPGEHISTTSPAITPETAVDWRQRLHFWPGRALTAEALELEQEHRAARLARLGRVATAGIVTGLEVALEPPPEPPAELVTEGHFVHLRPGHGVTVSGEDIMVPRPLRVPLDQIPIRYVRFQPEGGEADEPAPGGVTMSTPLEFGGVRLIVDELAAGHVPWAAVLVARPAELGVFGKVDPTDPCELDPSRDAFADERRLDAAVLRLFQLPVALENDPLLADREDLRWRNRLAQVVFRAESDGASRQVLRFLASRPARDRWDALLVEGAIFPWELFGVPLALLSSELPPGGVRRFFLDRNSITRPGGRARARSRTALRLATEESDEALHPPGAGTPALWRARVDQYAEHLSSLRALTPPQQAERFQFLPPAGLLPRTSLDFLTTAEAILLPPSAPGAPPDRAASSRFFPATISVEAVPVPLEDLDAALAASAPLAPYDLTAAGDEVRVLVPLAQRVFDPKLLVVELEDPFFAREVARLIAVRQDWRQRRDLQREARDGYEAFINGPKPARPQPALEPGQFEPEPVETLRGFAAYLSPADTPGPWEISANFGDEDSDLAATPLTPATVLFIRLRLDFDQPPARVEVRWRRQQEEFVSAWTAPSEPYVEQFDAAGNPLPSELARLYTITATELGVTEGTLTSFTLHFEDGRAGLIDAGELRTESGSPPQRRPWWTAADDQDVTFRGGTWTRVSGSRMAAPFEEVAMPDLGGDDQELGRRIDEIKSALNPDPTKVTPRATPLTVEADGLTKALAELEAEANEADDFVDANFLRAQTNLYRIRKLILGETAAQKLLINPAISVIAEQETASASAEKLSAYLAAAKARPKITKTEVNAVLTKTTTQLSAAAPAAAAGISAITPSPLLTSIGGIGVTRETVPKVDLLPSRTQRSTGFSADALKDVFGQLPESGPILPPRGLSIGKRFQEPPATNNLAFARAALVELVNQLPKLRLPLTDETVRSLKGADVPLLDLQGRAAPASDAAGKRTAAMNAFLAVTEVENDVDEAEVTLAALDFVEIKSAILRTIERVVQRRRNVIQRGEELLAAIRVSAAETEEHLGVLGGGLAEARHDVSVARALRQEEQQRVAAVNDRRDTVLRDEVEFLAYVRPRAVDPVRRRVPAWKLESAKVLAPVPACLRLHDQPPDALHAYVQLFRHASARWFTEIAPRLRELDSRDKLIELLAATQRSAFVFAQEKRVAFAQEVTHVATQNTLLSAFSIVETSRTRAASFQLAQPALLPWSVLRRHAEEHSSLGDIIDGRHGHPALAKDAAAMLERIESVATCLHAEFAAVAPAIRLAWVERYSQFDRPSPLNNLTVLPHYGSLDRAARRRFQAFVDWLFQRVDGKAPDALKLINDLIRICLLLASHAPVKSLIAGHLPRPVPVRPGGLIPVRPFDPRLVKIGMEVHVWRADALVARARVEDLGDGDISARVVHVQAATTTLDQTMRVQFIPPALVRGPAFPRK